MAIQIRRGSNAEWEVNNSNIVVGEPAVATDSKRAFIGTASGSYMELANLEAIAPAYDPGNSYSVDDYVSYQGKLYVCTVPTGGAWNASAWQVTSIGQALAENQYSNFETYTMSGDIVSFPNGAGGVPVKDLTVGIEAVQSGSGDPSPTNVRPISGWDEVNVSVAGKNLLRTIGLPSTFTSNGITFTLSNDGALSINGTATANAGFTFINPNNKPAIKPNSNNKLYIYSDIDTNDFGYIGYRIINKDGATRWLGKRTAGVTEVQFNDGEVLDTLNVTVDNGRTVHSTIRIMVTLSSDSNFEPFNGNVYTTSLGSTYYGGTLDVTTGVLTITWKSVDMGNISWTQDSSPNQAFFSGTSLTDRKYGTGVVAISSAYKFYGNNTSSGLVSNMNNGEFGFYQTSTTIKVKDSRYANASDFQTGVVGQTIVYELATPQTVTLSPTQVRTLLGQNNIWADSGEVEVTYRISNVQ